MRNATISTSRTRATADGLIDYRPLPDSWGDHDALRAVREAKSRAARHGGDPSTLQLPPQPPGRPGRHARRRWWG